MSEAKNEQHPTPKRTRSGWWLQAIPNAMILAALIGLAWWGHATGWTLPKFSELMGKTEEKKDDWCAAHNVPDSICIECQKDCLPKGKPFGWCQMHGIAECIFDHPELAQVEGAPGLPKYDVVAALNLSPRATNNPQCKLHERRIQFVSAAAIDKAGIEVDAVQERPMMEYKTANGEVGFDQTLVARLSSRVPGIAWWVPKSVGESVKKGEILALIDAADIGKAKSEFLLALAQLDQKTKSLELVETLIREGVHKEGNRQQVEAKAAVNEAETKLLAAQQALINWGFSIPDGIARISPRERATAMQFLGLPQNLTQQFSQQVTSGNLLPVRAPFDGVVVSRDVVAGEVVDVTKPLFVVANPTRIWLTLNVPQDDLRYIKLGQRVLFKVGDQPEEVEGRISWMSTTVDEKTRTVKVRADLPNNDGTLRANAFGTGKIVLREEKSAITVPNEAMQWEGDCIILFVRDKNYFKKDAPKFFHVRKVRPGAKDEHFTEILAGVLPGEVVAAKGSAVLRGELLRGNFGAG
jgi:cobalt-zinc-cadmium efflux system membrane fusion protein